MLNYVVVQMQVIAFNEPFIIMEISFIMFL